MRKYLFMCDPYSVDKVQLLEDTRRIHYETLHKILIKN